MSAGDPGVVFIHILVLRPIRRHKISKNQDIPAAKDFDDDDSQFMTVTINSSMAKYIYRNPGGNSDNDRATNEANRATENDQNLRPTPPKIAAPENVGG